MVSNSAQEKLMSRLYHYDCMKIINKGFRFIHGNGYNEDYKLFYTRKLIEYMERKKTKVVAI